VVEHHLAKVRVASSNLVFRSIRNNAFRNPRICGGFCFLRVFLDSHDTQTRSGTTRLAVVRRSILAVSQ
jgi:hypothetical protein